MDNNSYPLVFLLETLSGSEAKFYCSYFLCCELDITYTGWDLNTLRNF